MKFIELTLKNHTIVHGFDARNKEITEEVEVPQGSKKLVAVDRILSVSENLSLSNMHIIVLFIGSTKRVMNK